MREVMYHIKLISITDIALNSDLVDKVNKLFYDCKWDESERFYSELMNREIIFNNKPLPRPHFACIFSIVENDKKNDVGVCTIVIEDNNLIIENSCIKEESSAQGLFAQFRKTLFYELIYGRYNLSKGLKRMFFRNNIYFISFLDNEQPNYERVKRINNACAIDDKKIFNYIKKESGFKQEEFPDLYIDWDKRGYNEAFVIRVLGDEILERLSHHDSETIDKNNNFNLNTEEETVESEVYEEKVSNSSSVSSSVSTSKKRKRGRPTKFDDIEQYPELYTKNSELLHQSRVESRGKYMGKGLFSKVAIKRDTHICNFEGNIFNAVQFHEYVDNYSSHDGYWGFVQIDNNRYLDTYESNCVANYINSPKNVKTPNGNKCSANAKMVVNNRTKTVIVKSIRNIRENEEILMCYGRKFKL